MNRRLTAKFGMTERKCRSALVWLAGVLCVSFASSRARSSDDILDRPDSPKRLEGTLEADSRGGFGFAVKGESKTLPLEAGSTITLTGLGSDAVAAAPPFHFLVGQNLRLSGSLREISSDNVRFSVIWQAAEITLARGSVQSAVQRPGEARVLVEGFETLDPARWTATGKPEIVEKPRLLEGHSLRLPAGDTSLTYRLEEPLARGRCDIAFHDTATVVPGRQWSIEFTFRGSSGAATVRVNLGWSEDTLAVASSPNGPSLAVQRLARLPGWHRLSLRFGPERTEVSVDGKELANGRETDGPLTAIKVRSSDVVATTPKTEVSGYIDDLQLVRLVEPPLSHETDITQDEARLVVGDQLFGEITRADSQSVSMKVDGKAIALRWGDVSGLYFRRQPWQGAIVEGMLARVEWRSMAGDDAADLDFAEGALAAISDKTLTFQSPYAGTLILPKNLVRKLSVYGLGRRIIVDATAHHLGNELSKSKPLLDPVEPEGGLLERSFELDKVPQPGGFVVLNVLEVINENKEADASYWQQVNEGYLRTYVLINGQRIDYINHLVKTKNEIPETIRVPIPAGALHAGKNTLKIEQTAARPLSAATEKKDDPKKDEPLEFDDLGILEMAVEFPLQKASASPVPPGPP